MSNKETLEQKHYQTFEKELTFDEVIQRKNYLIASKKEKRRFLMGAGKVENEENSATYYAVNTDNNSDAKIIIKSKKEIGRKSKETSIQIFTGATLIANFSAYNVYINTADKAQISKFLAGGYPEAEYRSSNQKTTDLFISWYGSNEAYPILREKFNKFHKEEIKEIKKGLKAARQFFATFIGSKTDLKIAKTHSSFMERIRKFCKRLALRKQEPEIKTFYKHYLDNNRF